MEENDTIKEEVDSMNSENKTWDEILSELEESNAKLEEHKYVSLDKDNYYIVDSWGISSITQENGIEVKSFPPSSNEQYRSAYYLIDGEWFLDEKRLKLIQENISNQKSIEQKYLRIEELKQNLKNTDHQFNKWQEGWLTDEEYEPIRIERQNWRNEINTLEEELNKL
ncbi:MAG: hypothetical protein OSJ70_05020 [Bacilli bacterium]|nr:hypothetical protein [Bacilli bacterium]